jgi:hypothetical protein
VCARHISKESAAHDRVSAPLDFRFSTAPPARLFLPGALLVPMLAELLPPFVFVDFGFPAFFQ